MKIYITVPLDDGKNVQMRALALSIEGFPPGTFGIAYYYEPRKSDGIPVMTYVALHAGSGTIFDADSSDPDTCISKLKDILSKKTSEELSAIYEASIARIKQNDADVESRRSSPSAELPPRTRQGAVYLIRVGGRYKIGQSVSPEQRIASMQLPEKPNVLVVHYTGRYREAERELHMRFAHRRGHGEWFEFTAEELEEVEKAIRAF